MAYEVTTAAASLEFDTQRDLWNACVAVDDNHFLNLWSGGSGTEDFAQIFTVNTTTWAVSTAAASLSVDANGTGRGAVCEIDTNHFLYFWQSVLGDGFAQIVAVNTTTWACSLPSTSLEFDTQDYSEQGAAITVDANHALLLWAGVDGDGYAQVFAVNTTTWAVTTAAASLEFDTVNLVEPAVLQMDTNHFLAVWGGNASDGFAQVLAVNTTTWAVSTAAASLEFDTQNTSFAACAVIDSTHVLVAWLGGAATTDGRAQVLAINTTTWAVTTAGAVLDFVVNVGSYFTMAKVNTNQFIVFYSGVAADGFTEVLSVNTSTWAVSTTATPLEFDTQNGDYDACIRIDTSHFLNFWQGGATATQGFVQVFTVAVPSGPAGVATVNGIAKASVATVNGTAMASIASLNGIA